MKLNPGEHALLANFNDATHVQDAQAELQAAGITETQVDHISQFGSDPQPEVEPVGLAGEESSLAGAVLKPAQLGGQSRVLLAATPEASGMADGDLTPAVQPFLLTVVTSQDRVSEAVAIIERHGGRV